MLDTLQHQGQRHQLVRELADKYPFSPAVLAAIDKVPRHCFVDKGLSNLAYKDKPLPIAAKQTISQPFTVAMQTYLLEAQKWDRVMEIGTGCGYQTAILLAMGYTVFSVERIRELYLQAQKNLVSIGYSVTGLHFGDGFAGLPLFAPFKGILISCGAPEVPKLLLNQLAIGGKMVIPVGKDAQRMMRITRNSESDFTTEDFGSYQFVPMLTGTQ